MKNKYTQFMKMGLVATIISGSINFGYTKELNDNNTTIISKEINDKKNSFPYKENFLKTFKYAAFISLGITGLGVLGITVLLFRMGNAGKPIKRSSKKQDEYDFLECCYGHNNNDKNQIKYFLNEKSVNINCENDLAIKRACKYNKNLDLVKYLLTDIELKKHANIHVDKDYCLKDAYNNNHLDLVQYLIFDYKIPETKDIKKFIKEHDDLRQMFEKRKLFDKMTNQFEYRNSSPKNKI